MSCVQRVRQSQPMSSRVVETFAVSPVRVAVLGEGEKKRLSEAASEEPSHEPRGLRRDRGDGEPQGEALRAHSERSTLQASAGEAVWGG